MYGCKVQPVCAHKFNKTICSNNTHVDEEFACNTHIAGIECVFGYKVQTACAHAFIVNAIEIFQREAPV